MRIATVGIDTSKWHFALAGMDERGAIVEEREFGRSGLLRRLANLGPCRIAMEACAGTHHLARRFQAMGHQVVLMPAQYVKPYRRGQKNDPTDARGVAEAATRPTMRCVEVKSVEQQELQLALRLRDGRMSERTATANRLRACLYEFGVIVPRGISRLRGQVPAVLEDGDNELTLGTRELIWQEWQRLKDCDDAVLELDRWLTEATRQDPRARRLLSIPGVGPQTAAAVVAAVADAGAFERGRHFAAWLGLVPTQFTTGGKPRLLGITKRGNPTLRKLLVCGAQSLLRQVKRQRGELDNALYRWADQLRARRPYNKAVVAVANKLARIIWAVLAHDQDFQAHRAAA